MAGNYIHIGLEVVEVERLVDVDIDILAAAMHIEVEVDNQVAEDIRSY